MEAFGGLVYTPPLLDFASAQLKQLPVNLQVLANEMVAELMVYSDLPEPVMVGRGASKE